MVIWSVSCLFGGSAGQCDGRLVVWPVSLSVGQSFCRSIYRLVSLSVGQSVVFLAGQLVARLAQSQVNLEKMSEL